MQELTNALREMGRVPGTIGPDAFDETQVSSQGQRTRIARFRADSAHMIRSGRKNPFRLVIPAYEKFTTDGTADNTETFNLTHGVIQNPNVEDLVLWEGSSYVSPDSVDYAGDSFDYTSSGSNTTLHAYYVTDKAASVDIRKATPGSSSSASEELFSSNLGLVHNTNQSEQPEFFQLNRSKLQPFVATDMTLDVYIDAPYTVRFEDADDDETEPTNMLLHVPVMKGQGGVSGLSGAIKQDMSSR